MILSLLWTSGESQHRDFYDISVELAAVLVADAAEKGYDVKGNVITIKYDDLQYFYPYGYVCQSFGQRNYKVSANITDPDVEIGICYDDGPKFSEGIAPEFKALVLDFHN